MLDEQTIEKLSAYADGELDAQASGEIERVLAGDAELRGCLEQFRRLDGVAAALPVPQMSEAAGEALWEAVTAQVREGEESLSPSVLRRVIDGLPVPPVVPEERWRSVWTNVRARTTGAAERPLDADLTPGPLQAVNPRLSAQAAKDAAPIPLWRGFMALAAAAVVLVIATVAFLHYTDKPDENGFQPPVLAEPKIQPPEALDDRYFVMVKHVPGIEQPVVCFFLKEPDPELEEFESWQ